MSYSMNKKYFPLTLTEFQKNVYTFAVYVNGNL